MRVSNKICYNLISFLCLQDETNINLFDSTCQTPFALSKARTSHCKQRSSHANLFYKASTFNREQLHSMQKTTIFHMITHHEYKQEITSMLLKFIIQERFIYNCTLAKKSHFFSSASHSQYLTNIKRRLFSFDNYIRQKTQLRH